MFSRAELNQQLNIIRCLSHGAFSATYRPFRPLRNLMSFRLRTFSIVLQKVMLCNGLEYAAPWLFETQHHVDPLSSTLETDWEYNDDGRTLIYIHFYFVIFIVLLFHSLVRCGMLHTPITADLLPMQYRWHNYTLCRIESLLICFEIKIPLRNNTYTLTCSTRWM